MAEAVSSEEPREQRCQVCRWWKPCQSIIDPEHPARPMGHMVWPNWRPLREGEEPTTGWCHRRAPVAFFDTAVKSKGQAWPETQPDDWCGEFERR